MDHDEASRKAIYWFHVDENGEFIMEHCGPDPYGITKAPFWELEYAKQGRRVFVFGPFKIAGKAKRPGAHCFSRMIRWLHKHPHYWRAAFGGRNPGNFKEDTDYFIEQYLHYKSLNDRLDRL